MAQAFATGTLQPIEPLAVQVTWPNASATFAPGGFIPSPRRPDAASPVCAPGFSLLLTPFYVVGGRDAIFLLTPLAAGALIYLSFILGRAIAGDAAGVAAAILVAAMPVLVFQMVQPMNDVTAAALWMAVAVVAARAPDRVAALGILTGAALLVRPNLAPAAAIVALWCVARGWRHFIVFAGCVVPSVVVLLSLNAALYGHPLSTGYGEANQLFAMTNVTANVANYGRSTLATQAGFPLLAFVAVMSAPRDRRLLITELAVLAVALALPYLFYRPFEEWWYLRFLLPALSMTTVLATCGIALVTRRTWGLAVAVVVVTAWCVATPAMADALNLQRLERRFRTAGQVARERLPVNAAYFSVWESGSVRYHAGREVVVWDALDGAALNAAVAWLVEHGRDPYILIEDWEEPGFRERFSAHSPVGQLDWPPRFEIERRVKIYRPADRERYLEGESIPTEFITAPRR
jgi:hypothetical protein